MPAVQTSLSIFFNLLLLVIMYLLMKPSLVYPYSVSPANRKITIFLSLIFVLFSFWGPDWFHYMELYPKLRQGSPEHMEEVYVVIAQSLSANYLTFRLLIWGSALFLFYKMINRLPINKDIAILCFSAIWIIWFSYARVSLAMILVYMGMTLLYRPFKLKYLSYIVGICMMAVSVFFHKSAFFAIVIALFAIMSMALNKRIFILVLLAIFITVPIILPDILQELFTSNMSNAQDDIFGNSIVAGQQYLELDENESGLGDRIRQFLELSPYYLLAIQSCVFLSKTKDITIPKAVSVFMRALIIIVVFSFVFLLGIELNTETIYIRFMRFAFIPSIVSLSYFLNNKIYYKYTKFIFNLALFGTFYTITYTLYCSFAG